MPEGFIYNSGQVLAEIVQKLIHFEKNINIRGPIAKTKTKQSNFDVSVDQPLILIKQYASGLSKKRAVFICTSSFNKASEYFKRFKVSLL